jgi:hypothetical protein
MLNVKGLNFVRYNAECKVFNVVRYNAEREGIVPYNAESDLT